jgi:hypothetical protein
MNTYRLTYRCPDIHTQEDAECIRDALMSAPGVGDIEVDWRTKIVQVVCSDQDGGKTVLQLLIGAGFSPED